MVCAAIERLLTGSSEAMVIVGALTALLVWLLWSHGGAPTGTGPISVYP